MERLKFNTKEIIFGETLIFLEKYLYVSWVEINRILLIEMYHLRFIESDWEWYKLRIKRTCFKVGIIHTSKKDINPKMWSDSYNRHTHTRTYVLDESWTVCEDRSHICTDPKKWKRRTISQGQKRKIICRAVTSKANWQVNDFRITRNTENSTLRKEFLSVGSDI